MSTIDLPVIRQRIAVDSDALGEVRGKFGSFASGMGKAVVAGGAIAAAGIGAFVAKGVSGARDVERGVREVVTLFGETGEAGDALAADLQSGLRGVSDELGIAQSELSGGLYDAISAGIPKDNVFEFLEVAGQASVAGVTDVGTAVDGLTSTINAFGLDADQAGEVADSMFAAVQGGKTTFEELSASMFNVAPAAAAAGVEFTEVNAAIAAMTYAGVPTAQATTQIRAALVGLQKPSEAMTSIFQDLGYESAQVAIESEGLQFALDAVGDAADGDNGKLQTLLGSSEAVGAANILAGTGSAKFTEELERQQNAAGSAATAFSTMQETTDASLARLKTRFSNIATEVGSYLLPVIADVADWIGERLPVAIEFAKTAFATVRAVVDEIRGRLEAFGITAGTVREAFDTAVAAIGAAIEWVRSIFTSSTDAIGGEGNRLGEIVGKIRAVFESGFEAIRTLISVVTGFVMSVWERFGDDLLGYFRETWENVQQVIAGALDILTGIFETFVGIFTGDWDRAWEGVKQIFSGVWEAIQGLVRQALNVIQTTISLALAVLASIWERIWGGIRDAATAVWDRITEAFTSMVEGLQTKAGEMVEWVRELPGRILEALGDVGAMLLDAGRQIMQGLIDGIREKISAIGDAIGDAAATVRSFWPFSPAKQGPLSGSGSPERAGRNVGQMIASGIRQSQGAVEAASRTLAGSAAVSAAGRYRSAGGSGAASAMTFHGDIVLPNVTDRSTADDLLTGLRQAVRQGASA